MLKEPSPQQYQFETVTLDELAPEDHLVRKIDAAIDSKCFYRTVQPDIPDRNPGFLPVQNTE